MRAWWFALCLCLLPLGLRAQVLNPGFGYVDLRLFGAICDGSTNVQPAVAAAETAGDFYLYLPPNCKWVPTSNTIPANTHVWGGDILTSQIWSSSPTTTYLTGSAHVSLINVNLNHEFCINNANSTGCPLYSWNNQDDTTGQIIETYPYSLNSDVGHGLNSSGIGFNWISCSQRGDGGCLYGQFLGGDDHSAGSGIQAQTAYNGSTGQALLVSRVADGIGMTLQDLAGSEGVAHTPQPTMAFSTGVKVHGDNLTMFQQTSTWDGSGVYMNFGASGGAYTGDFFAADNAGVRKVFLDSLGNVYHVGLSESQVAAVITAASTIAPASQIVRVTGSATISTITPPSGTSTHMFCLELLPDPGSTWTTTTGGNILKASTAIPGQVLTECYDPSSTLFWASY